MNGTSGSDNLKISFDYKDKESKLVRFDAEISKFGNSIIIKQVNINGDFFATPTSIISNFELFLNGRAIHCNSLHQLKKELDKIVESNHASLIGIRTDIIIKAIKHFCKVVNM